MIPLSGRRLPMYARIFVASAALAFGSVGLAQDGAKPRPPSAAAAAGASALDADVARYCGNLAPTASEARIAYQARKLDELEARIKQQIEALETKEASAREWVAKRDAMMKAASEDVVSIYAKMDADAAAAQIATMDDAVAASILGKLKPSVAGAILGGMETERAGKLTSLMAGLGQEDKKS
jgi:flagellar motility protein MotE (MotC chaperone)